MSTQDFVTTPISAFTNGRFTASGYSAHMNFAYDKKSARGGRLNEWNIYQALCGDTVLQMAMGHSGSVGKIVANLFDIKTGERKTFSRRVLNVRSLRKKLDVNPEKPAVLQWFTPSAKMQFETTSRYRRLTLTQLKGGDIRTEIDVTFTNALPAKEKCVAARPFEKPNEWMLNYVENCFVVNGYCRIEGMEANIFEGVGVLNWIRGVFPRNYSWMWSSGATTVDGVPFGFDIGAENMFFVADKAYKLSDVRETQSGDGFRFADDEKDFVFEIEPFFDNVVTRGIAHKKVFCQTFGICKGAVKLPDGTKTKIPPFVAFVAKGMC